MQKLKKYYPISIIIVASATFYFWTRFWRFSSGFICPVFGFDSFSDLGLYTMLIIPFITALILGIKNTRLRWLYPTSTAIFTWLVPILAYSLLAADSIDSYVFMYYMFYSFFFVFLGQQIFASLGLAIGLLIYKIRIRTKKKPQ